MASYLPKNFTPRPEDYQAQGISQIPRDFLDVVVTPEFIEYWTELRERKLKKGKKDAWYTTWRNRARFLWKKKGPAWEENRHKRQDGGMRTDLFDTMLDKINGSASSVATDDEPQRDRTTYPGQRAATPATANPINGSEHRDTADNVSLRRPSVSDARITPGTRAPGAAAPMDPLEAIEKMKKILESA